MKTTEQCLLGYFFRACLFVLCLHLGAATVWADTHELTSEVNNDSDWSCSLDISGDGVKFLQEDNEYVQNPPEPYEQIILYQTKKKAEIKVSCSYSGALGENAQYSIWGHPGNTYTYTVENSYSLFLVVEASVTSTGPGGSILGSACQFALDLVLESPLTVQIGLANATASVSHLIRSMMTTPVIITDPDGSKRMSYVSTPWPDVGVKIEHVEGSELVPVEGWVRTNEGGQADVDIYAPVGSDNFVEGWLSGKVLVKAVKDGFEFNQEMQRSVPYSSVQYADHAYYKDLLSGEVGAPIISGYHLRKGDAVQIGTTLQGGSLRLQFCDGKIVNLFAEFTEGFTAVIGEGTYTQGSDLLTLYLKSQLQEWKDTPRRCLRIELIKKLGGVLDTALGIPGGVDVVMETPGGALSKMMIHFGEAAYTSRPLPPLSAESEIAGLATNDKSDTDPPSMDDTLRTDLSFHTDGTIYAENMGGSIQLEIENGPAVNVAAGAAVMMMPARGEQLTPFFADIATSTIAWDAPAPEAWTFSPADGATVDSRTPSFSITTENLVPESCRVHVDNSNETTWFTEFTSYSTTTVTGQAIGIQPLTNGSHTLSMGCQTLKGDWEEHSITFQVAADPAGSEFLEATAFAGGVWLNWQTVPEAESYQVWRAPSAEGTKVLLTSVPRQQPGFLDETPLAENYYWIETLDSGGLSALQASATLCLWDSEMATAPVVSAPESFQLLETAEGVRVDFDSSVHETITRWQVERGDTVTGPFTMLESSEQTLVDGYVDTSVLPGNTYYYRLSSLQMDGILADSLVLPVTVSLIPSVPQGIAGIPTETGVRLSWDSYTDIRGEGLRVYRYDGTNFVLLAELPLGAMSYVDTEVTSVGEALYQVRAYRGLEEASTLSVGVAYYEITTEEAVFNLPPAEMRVPEGDGTLIVPVTRTGNLTESASIRYQVWHGNKGQAVEDVDFEKTAGTLTFAPNQTTGEILVTILADSESEYPEAFSVSFSEGYGSAVAGTNWSVDIIIDESDVLLMADYQESITVNEINGQALVWIDRIWPSQREVSVEVAIADPAGTAVAGVDYTAFTPKRVTFLPGETRKSVALDLLDDDVQDGTKVLNIQLQNPEGGANVDAFFYAQAININDSDVFTSDDHIQFNSSDYFVMEDESTGTVRITVTRLNASASEVSVAFATSDGTAAAGSDYTAASGTLTWAGDESGDKTFDVAIANDTDTEGDETVNLLLSSPTGGAILGSQSSVTLKIWDDDFFQPQDVFLQLSASEYTVDESDGQIIITVSRSQSSVGFVSVNYATSDGTAVSGADYDTISGTLEWEDGDMDDKTFIVQILNDSVEEADETIEITLSNPAGAMLGAPETATLTILANDIAPQPEPASFSWNLFLPAMLGGR